MGTSVDRDVGIGDVVSVAEGCSNGDGWVVCGEAVADVEHEAVSTRPQKRMIFTKGTMKVSAGIISGQTIPTSFGLTASS